MELLHGTALRILVDKEVEWTSTLGLVPGNWPMDDRRQVVLFFKEALANILRHANANKVTLSAKIEDDFFVLEVSDDGRGFEAGSGEVELESLQNRAARVGGTVRVEAAPEKGTKVTLRTRLKT